MICFNAMLIAFGQFFPTQQAGSTYNPINVGDASNPVGENLSSYQSLNIEGILSGFFTTFVTTFCISIFVGFISGGALPLGQLLGASLVISIFVGLWNGLSTPLVGIAGEVPAIIPFYTLFTIVLGVVVMISVVEIFTGKGDETT
jgi:hypothetical protein